MVKDLFSGQKVDYDLKEETLGLTMGGEPTFVSL